MKKNEWLRALSFYVDSRDAISFPWHEPSVGVMKSRDDRRARAGDTPRQGQTHRREEAQSVGIQDRRSQSHAKREARSRDAEDTKNSHGAKRSRPDVAAFGEVARHISALEHQMRQKITMELHPVWSKENVAMTEEERNARRDIFHRTKALVDTVLVPNLRKDIIRPGDRHRHVFSVFVERILRLHSECATMDSAVYPECAKLLNLLRQYKLELSHEQCEYACAVAAREGRWMEAAELYSGHIDPEQGGFLPVSHASPTGLYCTAMAAAVAGSRPVENVMEAVAKLSVVSPSDAESRTYKAWSSLLLCFYLTKGYQHFSPAFHRNRHSHCRKGIRLRRVLARVC
jgi:hypothetical protein